MPLFRASPSLAILSTLFAFGGATTLFWCSSYHLYVEAETGEQIFVSIQEDDIFAHRINDDMKGGSKRWAMAHGTIKGENVTMQHGFSMAAKLSPCCDIYFENGHVWRVPDVFYDYSYQSSLYRYESELEEIELELSLYDDYSSFQLGMDMGWVGRGEEEKVVVDTTLFGEKYLDYDYSYDYEFPLLQSIQASARNVYGPSGIQNTNELDQWWGFQDTGSLKRLVSWAGFAGWYTPSYEPGWFSNLVGW